ncbi:hypothetical protein UFOVP116_392 [uncultured Caudovirales phage]|uniref:Uncharacterized protein n=1 Tax=uncultured Caudovirales phage TaxID=2100421 RepID=A0A6J5LAD1_9CAUD|nr:hypothetical protein UFOVP116_392 [uncultured Caudovirales phage]
MSYTINKTDGTIITTVEDGTIDNTSTDITLIGKNYSGYGEIINENFVKLLENYSYAQPPGAPIQGQLWWNALNKKMHVHNGTSWRPIYNVNASSDAPVDVDLGDMWWDTNHDQLKMFNGTDYVTVGPENSKTTGVSGAKVEAIFDNYGVRHVIVRMYVQDTTVAIISKDSAFTPSPGIIGFNVIIPGVNLASSNTVAGIQVTGTSSHASTLGGDRTANFLRNDINATTSGSVWIRNNDGLTIGTNSDFTAKVSSGTVSLRNQIANGDFNIQINSNGSLITALNVDGSTGALLPGVTNALDLGSQSASWANVYANNFNGTRADLAERYAADAEYTPGTVVKLGGTAEITAERRDCSTEVFGIISTAPAYLMNSASGSDTTHPPVVMSGRVPVRVIGKVQKFQRLVSAGNGCARAALQADITPFGIIGRALEDKETTGEGLIEAVVRISL